jgi:LCP family protein required for cell wall assembly
MAFSKLTCLIVLVGFLAFFVLLMSSTFLTSDDFQAKACDGFFLVLGIDSGGKHSFGGRTDFIAAVELYKGEGIKVINIPRDTLVVKDGEEHKINALYNNYGISTVLKTVEGLLNMECIGYVIVDFNIVVKLTNFTGPIPVKIDNPMHYDDFQQDLHIHFEPGVYFLEGEDLLKYARFRHDSAGDLGRIERQREVIEKLLRKLLSLPPKELLKAVRFVFSETELDFSFPSVVKMLIGFLSGERQIHFSRLPVKIDEEGNVFPIIGMVDHASENSSADPRILVLNNIPGYQGALGNFSEIVSGQWKTRTGIDIDVFPDELPLEDFIPRKSYIFINSREDDVLENFRKAHPFHNAQIFRVYKLEGLKQYFEVVRWLASGRFYKSGYDAIVILGVSGK